jgi:histidyl-tRNA synthetase
MIRGTRIMFGDEAESYVNAVDTLRRVCREAGYRELIVPSMCEQQVFVDKAGSEVLGQMYTFKDKGDRDICLIPEVTALVQKIYNEEWSKSRPKPVKVFYVQRCYRYEKPQAGRYREFTQVGVEYLGGNLEDGRNEVVRLLKSCLAEFPTIEYKLNETVKRGLSYYVADGFEVEVESLGAQKQIAGGGTYKEGVGFAIGLDRLLLAWK